MNSSSVRDVGHQAALGEPVDLAVEDAAGCLGHRPAVGPRQVGHHQCGARQPRQQTQGGEVRGHHHVAVAGVPARYRVAVDGVHVDVDGQQVVTALGAVLGDVLDEQPRRHPLAGQPALHIAERDDHGVDVAVGHQSFEVGLRQHAGSGAHCGPSSHDDGGHDEKPTIGDNVASAFAQMITKLSHPKVGRQTFEHSILPIRHPADPPRPGTRRSPVSTLSISPGEEAMTVYARPGAEAR